MNFTGAMLYLHFNKCLLDNALEKWRAVTPHEEDHTEENFKYSLEEWFSTLLPDNAFLTQKEWMMNSMKKPFSMKVKDFGNRLKTLNRFLALMPHDEDKDTIFSDSDLKALLLKSMPISLQNAYLLKGTRITDDFRQMLAYFVQFQNITDTQTMSKSFSTNQELSTTRQHKYTRTNRGQSSCFPSSFQGGQTHIDRIPRKIKTISQGPFVDFKGPCPVHPMSSHTWGGCYNNPKNKASNGQDNST